LRVVDPGSRGEPSRRRQTKLCEGESEKHLGAVDEPPRRVISVTGYSVRDPCPSGPPFDQPPASGPGRTQGGVRGATSPHPEPNGGRQLAGRRPAPGQSPVPRLGPVRSPAGGPERRRESRDTYPRHPAHAAAGAREGALAPPLAVSGVTAGSTPDRAKVTGTLVTPCTVNSPPAPEKPAAVVVSV